MICAVNFEHHFISICESKSCKDPWTLWYNQCGWRGWHVQWSRRWCRRFWRGFWQWALAATVFGALSAHAACDDRGRGKKILLIKCFLGVYCFGDIVIVDKISRIVFSTAAGFWFFHQLYFYSVFHCLFGHARVWGHLKRLFRHCIGPVPKTLIIVSCRTSNHELGAIWRLKGSDCRGWLRRARVFVPLVLEDSGWWGDPQHISRCRAGLDAWPNNFISAHCRLPFFIGFFESTPFLKRGPGIWVSTIMLIALLSGFLATYLLGTGLLPPRTSKPCSNSGLS